jgi:hypothetical protein
VKGDYLIHKELNFGGIIFLMKKKRLIAWNTEETCMEKV